MWVTIGGRDAGESREMTIGVVNIGDADNSRCHLSQHLTTVAGAGLMWTGRCVRPTMSCETRSRVVARPDVGDDRRGGTPGEALREMTIGVVNVGDADNWRCHLSQHLTSVAGARLM